MQDIHTHWYDSLNFCPKLITIHQETTICAILLRARDFSFSSAVTVDREASSLEAYISELFPSDQTPSNAKDTRAEKQGLGRFLTQHLNSLRKSFSRLRFFPSRFYRTKPPPTSSQDTVPEFYISASGLEGEEREIPLADSTAVLKASHEGGSKHICFFDREG